MISKALSKTQHLIVYSSGIKMRNILLLLLLSGCANVKDNTTLGDKAVIGGFFTVMILSAQEMAK